MSTHKIGFYEDLTKIIFQLTSNTHLISSLESLQFLHLKFQASSKILYLHIVTEIECLKYQRHITITCLCNIL